MSSLSQAMTVRSSIAAFSIGTSSSSRPSVMTKPPTCWERWRGKPTISSTISRVRASRRSVGSRPSSRTRSAGRLAAAQPQICDESAATVSRREAHRGADLADRPLAAVVDDGGAEAGAVAAVAVVDVLDHLLAALVLEVDVDVGRLVAGLGDEALEDHGADLGRDRGDAEGVADDRVRRRAAALAEDVLGAGVVDDVADGEEVGGVVEPADQRELVGGLRRDLLRDAVGIAPLQARARSAARGAPADPRPPRLPSDTRSASSSRRKVQLSAIAPLRWTASSWPAKRREHLGLRAQAALGVGQGGAAEGVDAAAGADAGQDVDEPAAAAVVHDRLGRGDERQAEAPRRRRAARAMRGAVLAVVARARGEVGVRVGAGRRRGRGGARGAGRGRAGGGGGGRGRRGPGGRVEVGEAEVAAALGGAAGAEGQQAAEPRPAGAVAGQGGDLEALGEAEPGGGEEARDGGARRGRARAGRGGRGRGRRRSCGRRWRRRGGRARRRGRACSCGWLPPVRKVKFEVIESSAKATARPRSARRAGTQRQT